MAGKAAEEDDLFALAAKGGGPDSETGLPDGRFLFGADGQEVNGKEDPGFETRVKPPTDKKTTAKDAPKETTPRKLPRGSVVEKQAADIAETLEEKFAVIFGLLVGVAPVTGTYGVENSPKAIRALLDIGKRRPAVMRALMSVANGADGLEIGKFVLGVVVALQVDFGKLNGDELPARVFGVTDIMEQFFLDPNQEQGPNPNVTEQATNVPRFQPVS